MYKKTVRTIAYMLICVLTAGTLTGCDLVPTLTLTEEQSTLIAEYAAGKLIEYVKGHPGGLMILEDVDRSEVNPGLKKEEEEELPPAALPGLPVDDGPMVQPPEGADAPGDAVVQEPDESGEGALVDTPVVDTPPSMSMAEALGIDGAQLTYDHYEVTSTYPENAEELAFTLEAAPGKQLLVVHFALSNPGSSDLEAHSDSSDFKVRLILNGGDRIRGDVTFLDNDLMNYRGLLTAGSSVDSVLVFEVPEESEIDSMDLLIVVDDAEQKYNLL